MTPISPKSSSRLVPPEEKNGRLIPVLGMAPIVLALTGDIGTSRIVIAAILTFYPVATNTLAGFKGVQKEKHELM